MSRGNPFPRNPDEFEEDERITYIPDEDKYLLVDAKNENWEWNTASRSWFQPVTEEDIAAYQQGYGGSADADEDAISQASKKRKTAPAQPQVTNKKTRVVENRAIYVSGLPTDATFQEIYDEFSRFGVIDKSVDSSYRIKMYNDDDGNFKGEALIVYFKKFSVENAINMKDDSWFRPGDTTNIRVQVAEDSYREHKQGEEIKLVRKDKKANERNRAELNRKLADWSDDDEVAKEVYAPAPNKWAKVVIIKHAFTFEELDEEPNALTEIKDDFREEAERSGPVTNVVLFDRESEGILTVKFKDAKHANDFVSKTNGRFYGGPKKLDCSIAQERPKFKKSGKGTASDEEEEADRLERLVADT